MIGLLPTVRAEEIRTRGSAASYLPVIGIVIAGISAAGIIITPDSQERAALLWQTLYVTGMATPLMTLLAGLTTSREQAAREGGTAWRAVNPRKVILARFLVLAALSGIFHAIAFWTVIPVLLLAGAPTDVPGILWAGLACWIATLGVLAVAFLASERWGIIPVFLAAWVWQLIGTLTAESALWPAIPPAWAVRAMLPILGAHQNAVPLSPDDPLAHESPALALALCVALAVAALSIRVFARSGTRSESRADNRPIGRRNTRPGVLGAVTVAMRSRPVLPLCAAAIALSIATAVVYPNGYLLGLHTYAVLPLGACITAALTWQTLSPGWRILVLRRSSIYSAVQTWLLLCVTSVSIIVTLLTLANTVLRDGADPSVIVPVIRAGTLWLILGAAGILGALWVIVRYGIGWALGASAVLIIVSATLGGDVLANTWLWILGPIAWPLSADTPTRFTIAVIVSISAAIGAWMLSNRSLRQATARGA